MSRASDLVKLIERFIKRPLNEGDMDGDIVVEGTDWKSTFKDFSKTLWDNKYEGYDYAGVQDVLERITGWGKLNDLDCVSCLMSVRQSTRGKSKLDYLVRMKFAIPDGEDPQAVKDRVEEGINEIRWRGVLDKSNRFGSNIKWDKKDQTLSCKFTFTVEKVW